VENAFSKGELEALGQAAPAVQEAARALRRLLEHLATLAPRRLDTARRALAPLLAETVALCRGRGILTFAALLRGARDLLADHLDVAARESSRIRQLLVDEFQDTDPLQRDLVRSLAFGPGERPGLFLVGDPKQSIFGWRDADLAVFERFRAEMLAAGGVERELAVNFRSQPEVLAEVDRIVEPVMVPEAELQPPYRPLTVGAYPVPPRQGARRAAVEHWISWDFSADPPGATRAERAAEIEAEAIAADLALLHEGEGVAWSGMCLLLRSFTWVDRYLDALRAAEVPFVVTRDKLLPPP
jgi:ATP-dependent helicase/nuclease subunit A